MVSPRVEITRASKVELVLAAETDPEEGRIDLTGMVQMLAELGLAHPYDNPADGVPFGEIVAEEPLEGKIDGKTADPDRLLEATMAGTIRAITTAIDAETARHEPGSEPEGEAG